MTPTFSKSPLTQLCSCFGKKSTVAKVPLRLSWPGGRNRRPHFEMRLGTRGDTLAAGVVVVITVFFSASGLGFPGGFPENWRRHPEKWRRQTLYESRELTEQKNEQKDIPSKMRKKVLGPRHEAASGARGRLPMVHRRKTRLRTWERRRHLLIHVRPEQTAELAPHTPQLHHIFLCVVDLVPVAEKNTRDSWRQLKAATPIS